PLTKAERARAKMEGRMALRHAEEEYIKQHGTGHASHEDENPFLEIFKGIKINESSNAAMAKVAKALYKAAEDIANEQQPAVDTEHHASKVADLLVESGSHNTRGDALAYLLHHPRGIATLQRLSKSNTSEESPAMDKKANLAELAKRAGVVAIAKAIVDEDHAFGITETELTDLVIAEAKKNHPDLTDAQAFAKVYSEQTEQGVVLRRAFQVAKNSAYHNAIEDAEKDA